MSESPPTHAPLLGERLPELTVPSTHGKMNLPDDMWGKWFVLFSHPADFTPVCTTEFVAFQNRIEKFREIGCQLIGMSIDQVFSHIKWVQWIKETLDVEIEFPIIAANDAVASKLGMLHPGKGTNTVRSVFIVDSEGVVRLTMCYPQEVGRNMDEILRAVTALQIADNQGAVPADWPNNSLIGDRIIVPPASDMDTAAKRVEEYDNFDWWFCHKPLET